MLKRAVSEYDTKILDYSGPMSKNIIGYEGEEELDTHKTPEESLKENAASVLSRYYFKREGDERFHNLSEGDFPDVPDTEDPIDNPIDTLPDDVPDTMDDLIDNITDGEGEEGTLEEMFSLRNLHRMRENEDLLDTPDDFDEPDVEAAGLEDIEDVEDDLLGDATDPDKEPFDEDQSLEEMAIFNLIREMEEEEEDKEDPEHEASETEEEEEDEVASGKEDEDKSERLSDWLVRNKLGKWSIFEGEDADVDSGSDESDSDDSGAEDGGDSEDLSDWALYEAEELENADEEEDEDDEDEDDEKKDVTENWLFEEESDDLEGLGPYKKDDEEDEEDKDEEDKVQEAFRLLDRKLRRL